MAALPPTTAAHPPLQGAALGWGTVALSLATFMNVLDSSIANVSLPAIAGELGVSPAQATWVISSFGVANAVSLPLTGWLTQRFGAVRLYMASLLLFVLASWLCGFAHSLEALVVFRVLQGLVSGPMIPLSQTLLLASHPSDRAGRALAAWTLTTLVAPVVGPLLGGWITDHIAWSWIFYINVPVGLAAAVITWAIYRDRDTPRQRLPIDRVGLVLLILGVGSLQLMLDLGKEEDWFQSTTVVALGVTAIVSLAVLVVWELTDAHPVVDLRLFALRNFGFGSATVALAYCLFMGNLVLVPSWLQQHMGYTATMAGMAMAPVGLLAILFTPWVGRKVGLWDARWLMTVGIATLALVLWMRSNFDPHTDFATIIVPTVVQGAAVPFFFVSLTTMALAGVPPERIPAATGLYNFVRMTAGALGVSASTTLWESRAVLHHAHMVEGLGTGHDAFDATLRALQASGMSLQQALARIQQLVDQQAYTRAADDLFLLSSGLFLLLSVPVWLMRRPPHRTIAAAADASH